MANFEALAKNGKAAKFCTSNGIDLQFMIDYADSTFIAVNIAKTVATPWKASNQAVNKAAVLEAFKAFDSQIFLPAKRNKWIDFLRKPVSTTDTGSKKPRSRTSHQLVPIQKFPTGHVLAAVCISQSQKARGIS